MPLSAAANVKIIGFERKLGPPLAQPPKIRLLSVDADVADARIRLKRKRPWSGALRKLKRLAVLISAR